MAEGNWKEVNLSSKLFKNVDETVLRKAAAAIENAFINEAGGHSRFPGMRSFCALDGAAPTYLFDWQEDLIAVTSGKVYRIDSGGTKTDVTGVPLVGALRPTFSKTASELAIAAGGPILRLAAATTENLSDDAPNTTHVAYIDGYLLAILSDTQLFQHSEIDETRTWNALDTFAADGTPDAIRSMIITPYREIILAGRDSVEQFERLTSSSIPFFRRWAVEGGIEAPYTLISVDQGIWYVNKLRRFVKVLGQTPQVYSGDVGTAMEAVDEWDGAWATHLPLEGGEFILLQAPNATNEYGTKGITFLYDMRGKKFAMLFGWDLSAGQPARWPGWSHRMLWGRHFVGGNGKVLELTSAVHANDGVVQRMLGRTAHLDQWGDSSVNNVRFRLRRGTTVQSGTEGQFELRVRKNGGRWSPWKAKGLGAAGDTEFFVHFGPQGNAKSWQWEWRVTDDCPVEITAMWALVAPAEQG